MDPEGGQTEGTAKRRWLPVVLTATAVVGVSALAYALLSPLDSDRRNDIPDSTEDLITPGDAPEIPAGWRWESSLGVEVAVPGEWGVNLTTCGTPTAPTVIRAQGAVNACAIETPEPVDFVEIGPPYVATVEVVPPPPVDLPSGSFTPGELPPVNPVNPVEPPVVDEPMPMPKPGPAPSVPPATPVPPPPTGPAMAPDQELLTEEQIGQALAAGLVQVDDAVIRFDVADEQVAKQILGSVHRVDIDHHGCATLAPERELATDDTAGAILPEEVESMSVCSYFGDVLDPALPRLLQASTTLEGDELAVVVDALNAAPPGNNPPPAAGCCRAARR